jgi:hypothetical protein
MAPAKKSEAAPKQTAMKPAPQQTAMAAKKQPEAAQKQQAQQPQQQQGQQQQQAPVKGQNERGMNRAWAWGANSDFANIPGGGQAYPMMNVRNVSFKRVSNFESAPSTYLHVLLLSQPLLNQSSKFVCSLRQLVNSRLAEQSAPCATYTWNS